MSDFSDFATLAAPTLPSLPMTTFMTTAPSTLALRSSSGYEGSILWMSLGGVAHAWLESCWLALQTGIGAATSTERVSWPWLSVEATTTKHAAAGQMRNIVLSFPDQEQK